jgi:hypothetical protein
MMRLCADELVLQAVSYLYIGTDGSPAVHQQDLLSKLKDLQEIIDSGAEAPAVIYGRVANNIRAWIQQAEELAAAAADRKRPRSSRSSQYIIASCDFLIAQLQTAVSALPQNPNKSVVMGASIKHRGDSWMMLVWKGMGVFAPVRAAHWFREFIIIHAMFSEHEVAWTMRSVRNFFCLGQVLAIYNVPEAGAQDEEVDNTVAAAAETPRPPTFISVEKLDMDLARTDQLLHHGTAEAVTAHDILARVGCVVELIGTKNMNWEMAFSRDPSDYQQRRLDLLDDEAALEGIIGPKSTWCIARQTAFDATDKDNAAVQSTQQEALDRR